MEDILHAARRMGIPYASRGSAASSLVAHCLGITSPDPIRLNLYFERFINPARAKPPDIDTDLCSRRRDELIEYVYQRYGRERVAMVATINTFRHRSALRETAKAFGLPATKVSALVENLPERWWGPPMRTGGDDKDAFDILNERFSQEPYTSIIHTARLLLGKPHHLSIHPGGMYR